MNRNAIRVGMIGVGSHCREVILPSLIAQNVPMSFAFCDTNAEARRWVEERFAGSFVTTDIDDLRFWDNIDVVICCASPQAHEVAVRKAIQLNKHCFCEKPLATSADAVADLLRIMTVHRPLVKVGHNFRYTNGGSRFLELLSDPQRRLQILQVTYVGGAPRGSRWNLTPLNSFALTHLTHAIDFIMGCVGTNLRLLNAAWSTEAEAQSVIASFTSPRCRLVDLCATDAAGAFTCGATAVFQDGSVVQLDSLRAVTLTGQLGEAKRSGNIWKHRDLGTGFQNDGYTAELQDFLAECLGVGHSRLPGLEDAKATMITIEQMEHRAFLTARERQRGA